ncbi:MAG: response regulator transcription factor [Bacteroidota bacterium]
MKIGLVDDHQVVLDGLKALIDSLPGFEVLFTATDGEAALEKLGTHEVNLLLLDLELPGENGDIICETVRKTSPWIKVVILSMHHDERFILHLIKKGANGYLSKSSGSQELIKALTHLKENDYYLPDKVGLAFIKHLNSRDIHAFEAKKVNLSERELEVLEWTIRGLTAKETGEKLFVSKRTIDAHRKSMLEKFDANNTIEMVVKAIGWKIIKIPPEMLLDRP